MSKLPISQEASIALAAGTYARCPGCMIERKIPEKIHKQAVHRVGRGTYECYAGTKAWDGVSEFEGDKS